ncbi:MAG TPA: adenylosuccinate synthase [Candidatus Methanomethylophilaceae archaeon]|nr:adenylosuccinate synthase [Candidatus Methanomethylophilaceae archaeon]
MPSLVIIGAQWGDEGKGKLTDYLGDGADMVVRFQGGNNAGHTIIIDGTTFKLQTLPSGVLRPGKTAVIGNGVVINMEELAGEIERVVNAGGSIDGLKISDRAHLIMDYHKKLDGAEEKYRGKQPVGTTKKGIGPAYQDKIARIGFRVADLFEEDLLREKIEFIVPYKKDLLEMMEADEGECFTEPLFDKLMRWRDMIGDRVCDTSVLINDALDNGKKVLFEGAQGAMLDIDHGTYPFVTSSSTCAGGASAGAGVAPNRISNVIGCLKAYTTRVGEGPMVTELEGEDEEKLQRLGGEIGVVTGRGRRCGWLDLVQTRHSSRLCGFTSIAITKIDILCGYDEVLVCTGYEIDGEVVKNFPASISKLSRAKPIYKTMKGWSGWDDTAEVVRNGYDALPQGMKDYISLVESELNVPVDIVSIGPGREETIFRRDPWHS